MPVPGCLSPMCSIPAFPPCQDRGRACIPIDHGSLPLPFSMQSFSLGVEGLFCQSSGYSQSCTICNCILSMHPVRSYHSDLLFHNLPFFLTGLDYCIMNILYILWIQVLCQIHFSSIYDFPFHTEILKSRHFKF